MTPTSDPTTVGRKDDAKKHRWSLLPNAAIRRVLDVLEYGAEKYAPENWKHVAHARTRYYDAAMRHLTAYQDGEKRDPESGHSHLAHAACCLLFMLWFDDQEIGEIQAQDALMRQQAKYIYDEVDLMHEQRQERKRQNGQQPSACSPNSVVGDDPNYDPAHWRDPV